MNDFEQYKFRMETAGIRDDVRRLKINLDELHFEEKKLKEYIALLENRIKEREEICNYKIGA